MAFQQWKAFLIASNQEKLYILSNVPQSIELFGTSFEISKLSSTIKRTELIKKLLHQHFE